MSISFNNKDDKIIIRLAELRNQYKIAKSEKDFERVSQLKYMAKRIKSGHLEFVY